MKPSGASPEYENGGGMLALVTDAFGGYGGIAQYNRDFLTAAAGMERAGGIAVLPRLAPGPLEPLPAGVRQFAPTHAKYLYALRAVELAIRLRPRVIFNAHIYHGPLALFLARRLGARLVSQLHGTEIWTPAPRSCLAALEASDVVLTVSRHTRARLLDQARIAPERVAVVSNTVGDAFQPPVDAVARQAARARFGLAGESAVLTVARLDGRDGYKGHDRIIPLVAEARAQGRDVVYLVAGDGPDRARLEALTAATGIGGAVRFLGKVPADDLPDLYRAADLFALPSTGEGFGIAFLEAMACGTPAIGLAVGGSPDALADGALGTCVSEAGFPDAFRAELAQSAQRDGTLAARTRAMFGFDVYQNRLAQVLDRVW